MIPALKPEGVTDEQYQRAWDSLTEADRQVLLTTAEHGYAPTAPAAHRKTKPAATKTR